jgi:hypothetical protein
MLVQAKKLLTDIRETMAGFVLGLLDPLQHFL